jgi:hypothetical protein
MAKHNEMYSENYKSNMVLSNKFFESDVTCILTFLGRDVEKSERCFLTMK